MKTLLHPVRMRKPGRVVAEPFTPFCPKEAPEPIARETKSALARKLTQKFVISVEIDPPKGADPGAIFDRAQYCKENEVDCINVGDGPRASARMSAQAFCLLLEEKIGIDTILHYT